MFDSPFEFCPRCGTMVPLDQTRPECTRAHGCGDDVACPLADLFSGQVAAVGRDAIKEAENGKQS